MLNIHFFVVQTEMKTFFRELQLTLHYPKTS